MDGRLPKMNTQQTGSTDKEIPYKKVCGIIALILLVADFLIYQSQGREGLILAIGFEITIILAYAASIGYDFFRAIKDEENADRKTDEEDD